MDPIHMVVGRMADMGEQAHMVVLDTTTGPLDMEPTMALTLGVASAGTLELGVVTARRLLVWVLGQDSLEVLLLGLQAVRPCTEFITGTISIG